MKRVLMSHVAVKLWSTWICAVLTPMQSRTAAMAIVTNHISLRESTRVGAVGWLCSFGDEDASKLVLTTIKLVARD